MTEKGEPGQGPPRSLLAGLFFLAAAVLMLEVLESRIFAFVLWHHFGFMVISMAMLGLAAAGSFLAVRSDKVVANRRRWMGMGALGFIVSLVAGHAIISFLPLTLDWRLLGGMVFLYLLTFIPFAFAGVCLVLPFRLYPENSGRLYTFIMIGSGVGTLVVMAGLNALGAERMLMVVAAGAAVAGLLFSLEKPLDRKATAAWIGVLAVTGLLIVGGSRVFSFKAFRSKPMGETLARNPSARVESTGWTPYCRIDVVDLGDAVIQFGSTYRTKIVFQDGDEPTRILQVDENTDLKRLTELSPYGTHFLAKPRPDKMLIVGPGGGLEVHLALYQQVPDITAVEINPFTVAEVRGRYGPYTDGVYDKPPVRMVVAEGRSFLRRSREKYDLITVNTVDTYTSLASGAYVLAESYLYTVEAMGEYLDHLSDDGVVSFFRVQEIPPRETLRLLALMVEALKDRGSERPEDHIIVINQIFSFTMMVKKSPFTAAEVAEIRDRADGFDYNIRFRDPVSKLEAKSLPRKILYAPGSPGTAAYSRYLLAVKDKREREFAAGHPFDLTGVTDDSPYFFKYSLMDLFVFDPRFKLGPILILAQVLQTGLLALLLVLWPLRRLPRAEVGGGTRLRALTYFGCLGFGYLLAEVAVMQKLVLFLGNPTYSLSVTLSALLISSGLGAILAERWRTDATGRWAALVVAGLIVAWLLVAPAVTRAFLGHGLGLRIFLAWALILPLGFAMGIPFPAGLRSISGQCPDLVPWSWATNSASSVMAAILCVPLAMNTNFSLVMVIAAVLYGVAALSGKFDGRDRS